MLRLDNTVSLQAVLSGAVTSQQPQVTVCASDQSATGYAGLAPIRTALNSTTDVTILAAPATLTIRDVDYLGIFNRDTASITVTIKYDASGTDTIITTFTLLTLETLLYIHGTGWVTLAANGALKTTSAATGILAAVNGGTGFGSYTVGDILYADTTTTLAKLADAATGNALLSGGVGVAPSWGKISLTTHVTGTLPVANGGTGTTTATGTAGSVVLSVGPTITGTFTATGLIDISGAGAGQIKFPATQNASADANTLDDYEEGTWTPTLTFGGGSTGITYTSRIGNYVKIGKTIFIQGAIRLSNKGSSTGSALISGLPFMALAGTDQDSVATIRGNNFAVTTITQLMSTIGQGTTTITPERYATGSNTELADTDFTNSTVMMFTASYQT